MFFADRLTLDKARRNSDGYMAIHAKAARSGIYQYLGREIDPDGAHFTADQIVNVYRPPEEVFDKASLASFIAKPITDDHPSEAVTSANWRDLARGTIMGAAKDGEYVGFDLAFMDAETITAIDAGKRELSNGYDCRLDIEDGTAPDGTEYQAVQREIRGNHVAVVDAGRAGSNCRIGDAAKCEPIPSDQVRQMLIDQRTYDAALDGVIHNRNANDAGNGESQVNTKTIIVDGLQVVVTDAAEAAILKLQGQLKDAADAQAEADKALAAAVKDKETAIAERDALQTQLTDARAAASPEKLRDAAKALAAVSEKAKALGVKVGDEMDADAIRKAAVDAKLGDKAKDYTADQITVAFDLLTQDAKADPLRDGIAQGIRPVSDSAQGVTDARNARLARLETSYAAGQA